VNNTADLNRNCGLSCWFE